MLEFQELTVKEGARLRPYYETCDYRLCEYSLGGRGCAEPQRCCGPAPPEEVR